jgi:hypothetical protein
MAFKQGEVIDVNGTKIVYIKMNRTRYVAADIADPTKSYTAKGGTSTGQFRPDVVEAYIDHLQKVENEKAFKQADATKYKMLAIGQAIETEKGISFVLKHKRTRLLHMDTSGVVWDSPYTNIKSSVDEHNIHDTTESLQGKFKMELMLVS